MSLLDQILSVFSSSSADAGGIRRVDPTEAARLVSEKQAVLVDVREPPEWTGGVAAKAALLPLSDLAGPRRKWKPFLEQLGGREILLYCHSGSRCGLAARILAAEGFRAANVGTLRAWGRAGLPICKPSPGR
jgi:rhodanese-related sulfurtransferase